MKNVMSWKTMSRIGVRFGSALESCDIDADMFEFSLHGPSDRLDFRRSRRERLARPAPHHGVDDGAALPVLPRTSAFSRRTNSSAISIVEVLIAATRLRKTAKK